MPEADQRAIAEDQIERDRRQREDHHPRDKAERVLLRPQHGREWQERQQHEQDDRQPLAPDKAGAGGRERWCGSG